MPGKRGNSEGSLSKRKDGLWEARITLQDGSRKSFYAKSRQDAARKLSEALRDRDKGLLVTGGGQSLGHYLLSWLEGDQAHHSTAHLEALRAICARPYTADNGPITAHQAYRATCADALRKQT